MAKVNEFDNILNNCLDRLLKGKSIKSCLKSYPQYATQLEPLLKTAQDTMVVSTLKPRPEFRQRAAKEFQAAVRDLPTKKQGWTFKWQLRWAVPVAILLVLLAGGSGTVAAATNALPDSPLYSIKMATESVQMAFTFSNEGKAELYARFVDYRVEEIVKMVGKGDLGLITLTTERMNSSMEAIVALNLPGNRAVLIVKSDGLLAAEAQIQAGNEYFYDTGDANSNQPIPSTPPAGGSTPTELSETDLLIQRLLDDMDRNLQILRDQLETAPEELRAALQHAIDIIEDGYWQVINSFT
jgi:hypothetical protein